MQKKIIFEYNPEYVGTGRATGSPADAVIEELRKHFTLTVNNRTFFRFNAVAETDADEKTIRQYVESALIRYFNELPPERYFSVAVCDYREQDMVIADLEALIRGKTSGSFASESSSNNDNAEANPQIENEPTEPVAEEKKTLESLESIMRLVGADEFKKLADECALVAPVLIKNKTVDTFSHRSYLFAINDGAGLTTYLSEFSKLVSETGLFTTYAKAPFTEAKLEYHSRAEDNVQMFQNLLNRIKRFDSNGGQIVCFDMSEWMSKTKDKMFRDFLYSLNAQLGENIYIFRVPFIEADVLNELKTGLNDILYIRAVPFVPFNNFELRELANASVKNLGFEMAEDAWEIFDSRVIEEKGDGRFYGINTVNKIVREIVYNKQLNNALNGIDDKLIKKSDIVNIAESYSPTDKTGMDMLDDMIGMEFIRDRINEIISQIEYTRKNSALGAPCIHMRFVGNPGTGKTTVARIIGRILKERHILRHGNFFEYAGRDFCGRYIGETAPKTAAMCRDAYGSVMFVDEAYSLYRGDENDKDYGREAIDTLIAEMENHRSDLVVIMAGYPDEMDQLMKSNPGLASRMPYIINFPNYTRQQLFEIFMKMTDKDFTYLDGFKEAVECFFLELPEEMVSSKEFSNARFVRNLFERTWGKAVLRCQLNKEDSTILTKEDFALASSEAEFNKIMKKTGTKLGFIQ